MINKTKQSEQISNIDKEDVISSGQLCYPILGHSDTAERLRQKMMFASEVNFPVFISGESGCEKRDIAYLIHQNSSHRLHPFICIPANVHNPGTYRENVLRCIELAKGGAVYFEEIDSLKSVFKDELIFLFSMDVIQEKLRKNQVRLMVSCTESLESFVLQPQYLSKILGPSVLQLNFHLPPLRERAEDIEYHIEFISRSLNKKMHLTPEAMHLMRHYEWPGNIEQLQHVLLSLASLPEPVVTVHDVLSCGVRPRQSRTADIIDCLLNQHLEPFRHYHPALIKALHFLSQNYQEDISLTLMSEASYTSASHLSYLFRKHLKVSFKTILCQVRVRFAQQLISENTHIKITDVCMSCGFGDLSHFEKMFKRYIGCTPRQYRNSQRAEKHDLSSEQYVA
ncbi:Regulatory protein LuxO [Vibrio aerogenes CECT 7868]|uniref:Regulatory protein LuxO n=1 Tax=Vibrio aerogenes CECT 7868 TaxID=1216006 RepID=A0A1M5WWK6_9VIBR|nr:AraC family transcriptional regulator [Vibrio aerogenes]SHH91514.1 Regulatory protein LuxO [Vibrio aerogenes CECT 7868]